jgi:hypothetical protein
MVFLIALIFPAMGLTIYFPHVIVSYKLVNANNFRKE